MALMVCDKTTPPMRRACGNCGMLGHLATTCKGGAKHYLKIGVEIEGYWKQDRWDEVSRVSDRWHMDGTSDGSLGRHDGYRSWEFRSRPGSLGEAVNQLVAIYPDATDERVGMHVHVSFALGDAMALASKEFHDYFKAQWEAWGTEMQLLQSGEFWKRLRGENSYCRPRTIEDLNMGDVTEQDRYSQINFSAWRKGFDSVECRLLPMFRDARIGVLAIEKLISIYETFLHGPAHAAVSRHSAVCEYTPESASRTAITREVRDSVASLVPTISAHAETSVDVYATEETRPEHVRVPRIALTRHLTTLGAL